MKADFQPASVRNIAHKSFLNTHKKETSLYNRENETSRNKKRNEQILCFFME